MQDIRNQRLYRHRRKQDMMRLKRTLQALAAKRSFYEEQVNYYNQYVKTCLDNLAAKRYLYVSFSFVDDFRSLLLLVVLE